MTEIDITSGGTYKLDKNFTGTITINTNSAVTLDGTNAGNLNSVKIITNSNIANLTIKNLTATNKTSSVISFGESTGNKLTLVGTNKLKTSDTWAAVVHVGGGLTIEGTGLLDVTSGSQSSGIGSNSYENSNADIVINGGRITATSDLGAGIGSGSNGSIGNITVNTVSVNATSNWGKGIGAGCYGSAGKVSITIVGDTGDDILIGTSGTDTFAYTGGNDIITNYGHEDTVYIKTGKIDSYSSDGSDLIFNIGSGSLRLNNMTNHAITVKDSSGKTTTQIYGTGYSGHEVMKRFVHSMANSKLNTKLILDEAIRACSHFNSLQEVINQLIIDLNTAGDAETFLKKYCGIFTDNKDNGSVIGWDAGDLQVKTTNDLLPTNYSNSYPTSTTFTKRGLTLTVPAKNKLTEDERHVVQKIYSADMEDSLKLIEETYGFRFIDKPLTIPLYIVHQSGDAPAWAGVGGITVNLSNGGDNPEYYLSHELTHVIQQHFGFFDHMPNFMFEGMADLTAGGDVRDALGLASDPSKLAQYLTSGDDPYTTGVIFWRYLMRQAADSYDNSKSYTWKEKSSIKGTTNAEFLTGSGKNVTISAGTGNDTLTVYGEKMKVFGEDGNDYILVSSLASGASIDGGLGNDSICNDGSKVSIIGSVGKDSIENNGFSVTIDGGTNDDNIKSHGNNVKVIGGDGNDTLLVEKTSNYNWDKAVWEDTYHDKATIDGGAGNDFIKNENSNVSINSGDDNDTIENHGDKVTINCSAGKDSIENNGFSVTIDGGTNDDNIKSHGNNVKVIGGDGNDTLLVEKTSNYNWDKAVWEDTYHNKATIDGGVGNDYIKNENANASIDAGSGNDSIENHTDKVKIQGGTGKDLLINGEYFDRGGVKVSISGGADNDTITNSGSNSMIDGGGGNDLIHNGYYYYRDWDAYYEASYNNEHDDNLKSSNVTIVGGIGNDSIINNGANVVFNYAKGEGNDTILGFNATSTLNISGSIYSTEKKDSDIIVTVGNNKIILVDAASLSKANVVNVDPTIHTLNDKSTNSVTLTEIIKTVDASSRTKAIAITGNALANTISGGTKNDSIFGAAGNDSILGNSGNDKLYGDAGNDILLGGKGNDSLWGGANNDTLTGNDGNDFFIYEAGKDVISDYTAEQDKIQIANGKISKTSLSGSDVLFTIGKGSLTVKNAKGKTISLLDSSNKASSTVVGAQALTNSNKASVTIAADMGAVDASSRTKAIAITGNALANTISGGTKNDSIFGAAGNDSILGNDGNDKLYGDVGNDIIYGGKGNDSLWGGAGNDTFTGGDGNDIFIYEAGKDFLTDYTVGQDKIQIASGKISKISLSGSDVLFTIGKGSLTVKNAKGKTISLIDSSNKGSSTVVGAQALTNSNKASVTIAADMGAVDASSRTKAIKITGNALANSISGGTKNDSIFGAAGNDSILGNDGNDKLYGDVGNDIIYGGKGNDSLWGGAGNDTFTGGDGNDIFIYEAGKDVISDYTAEQDKIQIANGKISKTSLSGSDVLFTIGKGSLTVKNAKGKTISLLDSSNKASSTVVGAQALTNSNKASVTIAADMGAVDASSRTKAIKITGNALANSISGGTKNDSIFGAAGNDSILGNSGNDKLYGDAGNDIIYGGKGNDSLWGGKGNDSLWGDAGADKFIYSSGDGKDVIFGFDNNDTLTLDNLDFKASYKNNAITFTVDGGSITLKNFSASTFHINNDSYKISGSKLVKK